MYVFRIFLGLVLFSPAVVLAQPVEIEVNDLSRFKPSRVTVSAGSKVVLSFKNSGKISKLKHSFVLLKKGVDVNQFGNALMAAANENGVPAKLKGDVLASSAMLGPGESAKLEFAAPEPGEYVFICGFPGHHSVSRGVLVVQ